MSRSIAGRLSCAWNCGHVRGDPIGPDIYGDTRVYCIACGLRLAGPPVTLDTDPRGPTPAWRRSFSKRNRQGETAMSLPSHRMNIAGRTFSSPWDASTTGPGAALERPAPRAGKNAKDVAFGIAMALVVGLILGWMGKGWIFGQLIR